MASPSDSGREAAVLEALRAAQHLMMRYPVASRRAIASFCAEGRRFAQTEEGAALKEKLGRASAMRKARTVWETTTLNLMEEREEALLPSMMLEALFLAGSMQNLEPFLMQLFESSVQEQPEPPHE